jgi:hypothetical protein
MSAQPNNTLADPGTKAILLATVADVLHACMTFGTEAGQRGRSACFEVKLKPAQAPKPGTASASPGGNTSPPVLAVRTKRRQPCKCGECRNCKDNARWERIFNQKFADPTYYNSQQVRHNSSLAGLR